MIEQQENPHAARFCITQEDDEKDIKLKPDEGLMLHIIYPCPSEHLTFKSASCSVELEDDNILNATSEFIWSYESQSGQELIALAVCAPNQMVTCNIPELEEEIYTLKHGTRMWEVKIPSEDNLDCGELLGL